MKGGNLRQIFLDCDGVLANMDEKLLSLFGIANAEDVLGKSVFWKAIANHPNFYSNLKTMPDAYKLVRGVKNLCGRYGLPNPIILTGLPQGDWAAPQKQIWREKNFPDLQMITCMSREKKEHMKNGFGDVLIDDFTRYRDVWVKAGGIFIHHTDAERSLYLLECTLEDHGARV